MLSFTDHARDPRVNRQVRFLCERWAVHACGKGDPRLPGVAFTPAAARRKDVAGRALGAARLLTRRYESYYWARADVAAACARLAGQRHDLVVANDLETLPLALRLADGAPVLFDAHEYAPLEFEEQLSFRLLQQPYRTCLCRAYIPRVAAMTTVCDGIARRYAADTGVRPEVVWNAPDFEPDLRPRAPQPGQPLRLVHHGGAMPSRRTELMIRAVRRAGPGVTLDLLLVGHDRAYLERLRREAGGDPRVHFVPPVPMRELARFLNGYDAGLYLLPPTNFNNLHSLPNKFFEFVQARLALVLGPSPEMVPLVERHGLGYLARDFSVEALAVALAQLTPEGVLRCREAAHAAARELSAESTRARLHGIAARLLGEDA